MVGEQAVGFEELQTIGLKSPMSPTFLTLLTPVHLCFSCPLPLSRFRLIQLQTEWVQVVLHLEIFHMADSPCARLCL